MSVEFGLVQAFGGTPNHGPAYVRDFSQAAEALGFHSIWAPEHIVFFEQYDSIYPYPPEPGSSERPKLPVGRQAGLYDPMLTCQAVAMSTTTLRVGTAVALLPLRHPLLWAREVNTVDHFSGGRLDFGIGVGWLEEEFAAMNVPFHERGRITDEYLGALHSLWTQDESTFVGEYVNFDKALSFPKPVQKPGPPIFIGGESKAALRRVASFGHGWYGWNMTPSQLEQGLIHLDLALAENPFVDGRIRTRADIFVQVGLRFPGPLDELASLVEAYAALGAQRVVASLVIPSATHETRLREIADGLGLVAPG